MRTTFSAVTTIWNWLDSSVPLRLTPTRRARMATPEMISDVGTGALVARAGLVGAAYNVRINLKSITDEAFRKEMRDRLAGVVEEGQKLADQVEAIMEEAL